MKSSRHENIAAQIEEIKRELATIGEMRPGSLTLQRRKGCAEGGYYQLSYTHRRKGRTEYVRAEFVPLVRSQIAAFHRFRRLTERWVRLAIIHAKVKLDLEKRALGRAGRRGGGLK